MNILEKIKSVNILRPRPGDILLVYLEDNSRYEELEKAANFFRGKLEEETLKDVKVIVTNRITGVEVIRQEK